MKNKFLRVTVKTVATILAILFFLLFMIFVGEKVFFARFFLNSDIEMKVPGLKDAYVPQGFDYIDDRNIFLACGYMSDGTASRIYIMNENGKVVDYASMKETDGSDHKGHTGGIAHFGNYIYVSDDKGCDVFLLSDLLDGDGKVTKCAEVVTGNNPAYCKVFDGKLYAGEFFYEKGGYNTPDSHKLITPALDKNTAIITVFELDAATGLAKSDIPVAVYSTTSKVQGMTMSRDGKIMLSTSWGTTVSHLYVYNTGVASESTFNYKGTEVPLIYLDSKCLVDDVRMPPMAEEIIYLDGEVYVMNESACKKYLFGNLTSGRYIYAYDLDD